MVKYHKEIKVRLHNPIHLINSVGKLGRRHLLIYVIFKIQARIVVLIFKEYDITCPNDFQLKYCGMYTYIYEIFL